MKEQKFYAVGGRQRAPAARSSQYSLYDKGIIVEFDLHSDQSRVVLEYVTPTEFAPNVPGHNTFFKAGTIKDNNFYLCTCTEVLCFELPNFTLRYRISLPQFNDLHHVCLDPAGNLVVANTGLDMVCVIDTNGRIVREFSVCEEGLWSRFDKNIDYRMVQSTKPHRCHPNYLFYLNGSLWVTRCEQFDALCLEGVDAGSVLKISDGCGVHDGVILDAVIYFTSVDGSVICFDCRTRERICEYDLGRLTRSDNPLGWCRSVLPLSANECLVGFTRLRRTKFVDKLAWIKYRCGLSDKDRSETAVTRVGWYDWSAQKLKKEINLEDHQLNAIYGIYRVPS